ncbi:MAG: hypothetical protein Kow00108_20870 [Calditrichia bacterium]
MRNLFITLCGTSILTNVEKELNKHPQSSSIVLKNANAKTKEEIDMVSQDNLSCYVNEAARKIEKIAKMPLDDPEVRKASAEINSYARLFVENKPDPTDVHFLLCTDTWLGERTATLVQTWLKHQGVNAQIHRMIDVRTVNTAELQVGFADLIKWIEEVVVPYRESNYKIIFNLTGGFKILMGFLQTLAHFYSDEAIYIFESGYELIRIPRIPVKLDNVEVIKNNFRTLRRLSLRLSVDKGEIQKLPDLFLFRMDDGVTLSAWGELIFQQIKNELYKQKLWEAPCDKVKYTPKFINSVQHLPPDRIRLVNIRVDDLTRHLETDGGANLKRLDLKPLTNSPFKDSDMELDAWADRDAKRIFCHFEGDRLVLDELGNHL